MCMQIFARFHPFIRKILSGNKILTKVKGHNSDNNQLILSLIELDLFSSICESWSLFFVSS